MGLASLRLVAFVCLAVGLLAQTANKTDQSTRECKDATTTAAMRICEASRYEVAQRELDAAYQSLMERLDNGQKQKLRLTQRAWLRFRDSNADFQASLVEGGTLAPLIRISTLTEMTKARILELSKKTLP